MRHLFLLFLLVVNLHSGSASSASKSPFASCPGTLLAALPNSRWPLKAYQREVIRHLDSFGIISFEYAWSVESLLEGKAFNRGVPEAAQDPQQVAEYLLGKLLVIEDPSDRSYSGLKTITGKIISVHHAENGYWLTVRRPSAETEDYSSVFVEDVSKIFTWSDPADRGVRLTEEQRKILTGIPRSKIEEAGETGTYVLGLAVIPLQWDLTPAQQQAKDDFDEAVFELGMQKGLPVNVLGNGEAAAKYLKGKVVAHVEWVEYSGPAPTPEQTADNAWKPGSLHQSTFKSTAGVVIQAAVRVDVTEHMVLELDLLTESGEIVHEMSYHDLIYVHDPKRPATARPADRRFQTLAVHGDERPFGDISHRSQLRSEVEKVVATTLERQQAALTAAGVKTLPLPESRGFQGSTLLGKFVYVFERHADMEIQKSSTVVVAGRVLRATEYSRLVGGGFSSDGYMAPGFSLYIETGSGVRHFASLYETAFHYIPGENGGEGRGVVPILIVEE